jgi:hypothetical protein
MQQCSIDGCTKPAKTRTWCALHYRRWRVHGDPLTVTRIWNDDRRRILSKVTVTETGCWEWGGYLDEKGYGRLVVKKRFRTAHSVLWVLERGPVPEGLELDHLCRNRACVNPDHLEPVTHRENMLRGAGPIAENAAKTHCKYGHPFDEENTILRPNRPGTRECRACHRRDRNKARSRRVAEGASR